MGDIGSKQKVATDSLHESRKKTNTKKNLRAKRDRVDDLLIQGAFDLEAYKRKSEDIKGEMLANKMDLSDAKTEINDIEGCLLYLYCKYFLSNLADLWATSDLNLKQRFQTLIFPEKIYYENNTFRTL